MEYIPATVAAGKWGVSLRHTQRLLAANRIPNAKKYGRVWMIPANAEKPGDARREKETPKKDLAAELNDIIEASYTPLPLDSPDKAINTAAGERMQVHIEGELAYLRGDFEYTKRCFLKTKGDDVLRMRFSAVAIAAAINMGDYPFYQEVETFLKGFSSSGNDFFSIFAEFCISTAYVSALAPNMVPGWLKNGDFAAIPAIVKPEAAYRQAKYFQCIGNYESMLAVAQTALSFWELPRVIAGASIYLRVACAIACHALGRFDEAKRWMLGAMGMALPHGFITPFAETIPVFGGLLEQLLEQKYPEHYDPVVNQCKRTFPNWITFHNRFTGDNITLVLSLREFEIAAQVAQRVPYERIAGQFNISVGRLKTIIHEIYGKLYVNGREELAQYIVPAPRDIRKSSK